MDLPAVPSIGNRCASLRGIRIRIGPPAATGKGAGFSSLTTHLSDRKGSQLKEKAPHRLLVETRIDRLDPEDEFICTHPFKVGNAEERMMEAGQAAQD